MTNQTPSPNDLNKPLFVNLISMLSMSAMQELGKLKNPFTGKTEVQLAMAQATIDMLDMLEVKTRGNRDRDEDKLLKDTLTMLKINYVETDSAAAAESQVSRPERDTPETGKQKDKGPIAPTSRGDAGDQQVDQKTAGQEDKKATEQGDSKQTAEDKPQPKDPKFHKSYS
ncbi:MAG: DUF1844 domain-containing protein [Verrucomicrobia bacterium]|nr:DUF1844 domain-containing protein [Verrucomicrobiota bacterium]MBU4290664.1 DUF1844 domain-containing protein [Verrucomicrobiota bacterium]MBU4430372.1 DUF1844 domain-containing protein [Verrucomicrobiota bacterium]MCG2681143.1 DUF1844 domain-containing protein [Kiritimatiellia bacterium]